MRRWLRSAWVLLAVLVALASGLGGSARAQTTGDDAEKSPRDVPIVVQPSAIVIPPLPETDQVRDMGWLRVAYPPRRTSGSNRSSTMPTT